MVASPLSSENWEKYPTLVPCSTVTVPASGETWSRMSLRMVVLPGAVLADQADPVPGLKAEERLAEDLGVVEADADVVQPDQAHCCPLEGCSWGAKEKAHRAGDYAGRRAALVGLETASAPTSLPF